MSLINVVPTAIRTISGSESFDGWTPDLPIVLVIDVDNVSGTSPNLDIHLQANYGGNGWSTVRSATSLTSETHFNLPTEPSTYPRPSEYRIKWDISGTSPSFTFGVSAYALP